MHIERAGPFDVVDLPPVALDRRIARNATTVVRSVQPDWLYFRAEWARRGALSGGFLRAAYHFAYGLAQQRAPRRGVRLADKILCLGSAERHDLARRHPRLAGRISHYVVAPILADQRRLAAIRTARRIRREGGCRFLWIGRWQAHKGTERLVDFLIRRRRQRPEDSTTIAGCGSDAEASIPRDLISDGRVRILPSFSRAELVPLLAGHDAGLFTSVAEGWGLSLNEMLESGLPVYATEAGGVADLRPYFPTALRPFPPPMEIETAPTDDPEASGYYRTFHWERIAERYERDLLSGRRGSARETT
jgi:glycosyltransferase involved in cell wall biosynthesis